MTLSIGEQIRLARRRAGMTQEQLARITGVGQATLSQWERDRVLPRVSSLIELTKHLGVTFEVRA